jgi:hypothetical protein
MYYDEAPYRTKVLTDSFSSFDFKYYGDYIYEKCPSKLLIKGQNEMHHG